MPVGLYLDVHVPRAIADQLRLRGIDVVMAQEDGTTTLADDHLLERSSELGRVLFTQDIRFKALAESWQRSSRPFSGVAFGHQLAGTIGRYVQDLELIAKATDAEDWVGVVMHLPL